MRRCSEEEDVARRLAQADVQLLAVVDAHHLAPRGRVRRGVEERQQGRPRAARGEQRETEGCGNQSQQQVAPAADGGAGEDDDRALAAAGVLLAVAEVVEHEHRVDHQSAGQRDESDLRRPLSGLHVVGEPDGNQSEEEHDGRIAQPVIGQRPRAGGVEVGEDDASQPHGDELPASVGQPSVREAEDARTRRAGRESKTRDARLHGRQGDIAFGEGPVGTETVGTVGPFEEVPEVVHQIGRALHQQGEREAERGRNRPETAVGPGHRRGDEDEDDRVAQAVRADGQNPG